MFFKIILSYLVTLFIMLSLDIVWLFLTVESLYKKNIGHLMASQPNYWAALIFYCLYALGLTVLIILPTIHNKKDTLYLIINGGLLGMVAYATYDLTNQATLKDWPLFITVIDIMWGTAVTAASCVLSVKLIRIIGIL